MSYVEILFSMSACTGIGRIGGVMVGETYVDSLVRETWRNGRALFFSIK